MTTTTQLSITHLVESQASAEVSINDALNKLDAVIQLSVKDRHLTAPPASPAEGDRYIPAATATGLWAGHEGKILVYLTGWVAIVPRQGFKVWVEDENLDMHYTGTAWVCREVASIAASTTQTQAAGTVITTEITRISSVITTGDAVTLPPAIEGRHCLVYNNSGTTAALFPSSGDKIDGLSVDAARNIGGNNTYDLWAINDSTWAFG
tara:strand:+ start:785 stop:1408 length:624 start_codon:yes stop_codon:yes gene_type:complete